MKKKELRALSHPELCWPGMAGRTVQTVRDVMGEVEDVHAVGSAIATLGLPASPSDMVLVWALHCWEKNHKPLFYLDEQLAWALANTEPPMDTFDLAPTLPINGMYLLLPPVFEIENDQTGMHKVEGMDLTENPVLVPKDLNAPRPHGLIPTDQTDAHFDVVRGITILGVGEDKSPDRKEKIRTGMGWMRDDALLFFHLVPGKPIYFAVDGLPHDLDGSVPLARVVVNLLYMLQNTREIRQVTDDPRPELRKEDRSARRERERERAKGRSVLPCTVLKLSSFEKPLPPHRAEGGTQLKRKTRGHIVLGHIHHYWVRDPQGLPVLDTRVTEHGTTLVKIAKWLLPYLKGAGPIADKNVRLT